DAPGPSKSLDAPFVGREDQFGTLVEAFHRARRGQTEVVVLEGEAGIGKTRLASEFVNWARAQGADLLIGRAFETGGQLPYQALVDAFGRRLDDENAPDDLIANVWLAELSRLLPDLRERYPDLEASAVDDNAGPARLFEAVARLCEALARRSPLVLLVDDLQWADRASFDLLRHIARRGTERHAPIVFLLTLRTESLATSADLVEWLAALSRDHPIARVALRSLSVDDLRKMLARLGVDGDIASLASRLHAETKGQPFFTVESLRALVERGVLVARNDRDGRRVFSYASTAGEPFGPSAFLPATVRQMITGRLARLSRPAADLLVASAILGQHGTFTPLCAVAGLSEEQALPALDETMGRQLLGESRVRATATAPVVYLHTHDKIREVVYTDAGDARRRVFHRRAVEALRRIGAPAAELAHHARAAGLVDEAIAFSVEAGEDSLRLYALRDAIDHFQLARETLADYPSATATPTVPVAPRTELTSRLFLQMGRAYELQSERDSARAAYESLLGHARASRQPSIEVTALNRLATLTAQNGTDFDRATALLEAGRAIAEASEDRLGLVETEWNLAQMGIYTSNPPMALRHGERALELARAEGAPELIARSLNALAYAYRNLGRWEDSAAVAGEAAKHFAELGNAALEIDSLGLFASSQVRYGALRDGIHAGRRALALSREIENPWGQVASAYHLVPGLLDAGRYGEARDVARQGTDTARVQATRPMLIFSLVELGAVQRALLSLDDAREIHQEALTLSHGLPGLFQDMAAAALCADEALAGRWEPAYEAARLAIAGRNGTIHQTGLTRWLECEALVRGGDRAAAERDTALFGEHIGANRRVRIPYLRCLAVLARAGGNFVEAVGYLDEAAALARSIGLPGETWSIDVALADAYRALGNPARAINALGHAASTIESLAESLDAATRTMFLAAAIPR
ncbi:MAG TPA: AAA family ATPase, partial [Chloroflexota bacterium]|nr:AAA family ATPase [Chloroflexota bacterium]